LISQANRAHRRQFAAPPEEITTSIGVDAKKEPNPAYTAWLALDHQVFSYVIASLTRTS
jgi:hypothetical protein